MKIPLGRRIGAGLFFAAMGLALSAFTLLDVTFHYLARKRRAGLGRQPWLGALWGVLLFPTRRAFWAMGFWIGLGVLLAMVYQIFIQGGADMRTAAGLP